MDYMGGIECHAGQSQGTPIQSGVYRQSQGQNDLRLHPPQAVSSCLPVCFAILPSGAGTSVPSSLSPDQSQGRTVQLCSFRQRQGQNDVPAQATSSLVAASSAILSSDAGTSLSRSLSSTTTPKHLPAVTTVAVRNAGGIHEKELEYRHSFTHWKCTGCR